MPGVMVAHGSLLVGAEARIPAHRVEALIHHEVGTHLVTGHNGAAQSLKMLAVGLPGYEQTQEGLAVLAELSPVASASIGSGRLPSVSYGSSDDRGQTVPGSLRGASRGTGFLAKGGMDANDAGVPEWGPDEGRHVISVACWESSGTCHPVGPSSRSSWARWHSNTSL